MKAEMHDSVMSDVKFETNHHYQQPTIPITTISHVVIKRQRKWFTTGVNLMIVTWPIVGLMTGDAFAYCGIWLGLFGIRAVLALFE